MTQHEHTPHHIFKPLFLILNLVFIIVLSLLCSGPIVLKHFAKAVNGQNVSLKFQKIHILKIMSNSGPICDLQIRATEKALYTVTKRTEKGRF